jgi:hypothetical protein
MAFILNRITEVILEGNLRAFTPTAKCNNVIKFQTIRVATHLSTGWQPQQIA